MKKLLCVLPPVIAAMLLFCFAVSASAETEGIFTYTVSNGAAMITAIDPTSADTVVIPDTLGGYPVTSITGNNLLQRSPYVVENLVIPAGITEISRNPFNVARLSRFTVAEENTAFCSVEGVLLDKAQTTLISCPSYYPETEYTVPATVTRIGDYAFANARSLTKVTLPEGVLRLGNQAFAFTSTLKDVNFPSTLTTIVGNCFGYNTAIEEVILPESVVNIGASAFTDCNNLKTVLIAGNVQTLPRWLFDNTSLQTVYLPASLVSVTAEAFVRTTTIERILFAGSREQWEAIEVGESNGNFTEAEVFFDYPVAAISRVKAKETDGMLTVSGGALPSLSADSYRFWNVYAGTAQTLYITGGVTGIGGNSFTGFSALSTVIVDCAADLAPGAFADCGSLRNVILLGGGSFAADSFPDHGEGIDLFAADGLPTKAEGSAVGHIPVSYSAGVLTYGGDLAQDPYDFFDVLSVFCGRYGEIRELHVESFSLDGVTVYYYDPQTGARRPITEPLTNGVIYPLTDAGGGPTAISFNTLCDGIADGSVTSFYLVINDEAHPDTEDTQVSIVDEFASFVRRALRAIVTLLNKLFRLIKSFM